MKTKELDVWVSIWNYNLYEKGEMTHAMSVNFDNNINGGKNYKAKLVIELPEKKVELTESRFMEIMNNGEGVISVGVMKYLETELGFNK